VLALLPQVMGKEKIQNADAASLCELGSTCGTAKL